jgi:hypothetical protein
MLHSNNEGWRRHHLLQGLALAAGAGAMAGAMVVASAPPPPPPSKCAVHVKMLLPQEGDAAVEHSCSDDNLSEDDAQYMRRMVGEHLWHQRSQQSAQDPSLEIVHQFFEESCTMCPCQHPYFAKALQLLVYITEDLHSVPRPRPALQAEGGIMGRLVWDWRRMDTVNIENYIPLKITLNIQHYEETGYEEDEAYEFRLLPKVSQDWYPEQEGEQEGEQGEQTGETCVICLSGTPEFHLTTPCGHHFHHACMAKWREHGSACPMCMAAL